jgi:hypothetical protein
MKEINKIKQEIRSAYKQTVSFENRKQIKKKHPIYTNRPADWDGRGFGEQYTNWLDFITGRWEDKWLAKRITKAHLHNINKELLKYISSINIIESTDRFGPEIVEPFLDMAFFQKDIPGYQKPGFNSDGEAWHVPEDWNSHWLPYNNLCMTIQIVFHKAIPEDIFESLGSLLKEEKTAASRYDDAPLLSKKIAKDLFLFPGQIEMDFKLKKREDAFERLSKTRLKNVKKQMELLGNLSNPKNYKYKDRDWFKIKKELMNEYVELIRKFETEDAAQSFKNMLKMFNDYNVKVEKKEAHKDEPRKDK